MSMKLVRVGRLAAAATLACMLVACGGGGGGGSNGATGTPGQGNTVTAPQITTPPQAQTVLEGDQAQFSVTASGASLSYQWRQNDVDIQGETAPTLTLNQVMLARNGARFRVLVSNSAGSSLSVSATLTVQPVQSPVITAQPAALSLIEGEQASFTVGATGVPQPTFQWRRNGQPVPGATSPTFAVGTVQAGDDGASFDVVISNRAGSATSTAAVLSVARTSSANAPVLIAAGNAHTCSVMRDGSVYCWGSNSDGQLGVEGASRATPTLVAGLAGIRIATRPGSLVTGAQHTCAVAQANGQVYCWGDNRLGQLGNGSTTDSPQPVLVSGLSGVLTLAASEGGTCALFGEVGSSQLSCWGRRFEVPAGATSPTIVGSTMPVREATLVQNARFLAGGNLHNCVSNDSVRCWGSNIAAELGAEPTATGIFVPSGSAAQVATMQSDLPVLALAAGAQFSCGIFAGEVPSTTTPKDVGVVKCWGNNSSGELGGVGGVLQSAPPLTAQYGAQLAGGVIVATGTLYASVVVAGRNHGCAIADDRRVHCWGRNQFLQVGFAPGDMGRSGLTSFGVRSAPTGLESTEVVSLAAGGDHSCAITRVANIKCWGRNDFGQLGRPAGDPQTPADVQGLPTL